MLFVVVGISFTQSSRGLDEALVGGSRLVWLTPFPQTVLVAFLVTLPLWISELLRRSLLMKPLTRTWYLTSIGAAALAYPFIVFTFFTTNTWSITKDFDLIAVTAVRGFLILAAFTALLGYSQRRLALEVQRANEATAAVLSQRALLVRADEASRRSVADFLHDRVQSMLVTSTMQLREIAKRTDKQSESELLSVAEHLDEVRVTEVREANIRLSPNIAVVGLEASIRNLLTSLTPSLQGEVSVDSSLTVWATHWTDADLVPMGVFRIVEQAVSNAVIHGRANEVSVGIESEDGHVLLRIQDDGSGMPATSTPGSGTAIIESWVEMLGATWTRSNRLVGGVEVLVRLPARSR